MDSKDDNLYYIVTREPETYRRVHPGRLCYIPQYRYESVLKRTDKTSDLLLPVICLGSSVDYRLLFSHIEAVSKMEAELLQALDEDSERLHWFREKTTLKTAVHLKMNTAVFVNEGGKELRGLIRFIGKLTDLPYTHPISSKFFGIELQGEDKGKGPSNGKYNSRTLFTCERNCGIFVPFSRVRPAVPNSLQPPIPQPTSLARSDELNIGDRVTFYLDHDHVGCGMVMDLEWKEGQQFARISTDKDVNGDIGGEVKVPVGIVSKEKVAFAEPEAMDTDTHLVETKTDAHPMGLGVNSRVEVTLGAGDAYGTIRWIGFLPDRQETLAGLELEGNRGVSDGTFKGQRLFSCPPGRALFVKLLTCRPDSRFQDSLANHSEKITSHEIAGRETSLSAGHLDNVAPISTDQVSQVLIGRMKGIQGHCNSCYMDAAIFSLFSCCSVLDSLLYKFTEPRDTPIQNTLLHDIVNPLRSKGFVEGKHVMKLRQQLQNHGYSGTFTTDEKDPEEFLTVIMQHILALEPLLKLSAGGDVQESYCYQIFLDHNHSLVLPTVQQLLEHSFYSAGLKLAEVPSCFILQMPRFGKKFKMFEKIIPSLELDVTDLLSEGPQQCMLCGQVAHEECLDCFKDSLFSPTGFKHFCRTCSSQVHLHPQRRSHRPTPLRILEGFQRHGAAHTLARDKLELFAVLCIETSHYVSFIKHGPGSQDWIFFDSMADRLGEKDGYNIPQVQACPEVGVYLDMSPAELAGQVPRDMKGVAKRLFCDAYMYLYQSTSMCLYR